MLNSRVILRITIDVTLSSSDFYKVKARSDYIGAIRDSFCRIQVRRDRLLFFSPF